MADKDHSWIKEHVEAYRKAKNPNPPTEEQVKAFVDSFKEWIRNGAPSGKQEDTDTDTDPFR